MLQYSTKIVIVFASGFAFVVVVRSCVAPVCEISASPFSTDVAARSPAAVSSFTVNVYSAYCLVPSFTNVGVRITYCDCW